MTIIKRYSDFPSYMEQILSNHNSGSRQPLVNIIENDDHFTLELAAPGYLKEDFELNLDQDELKITASRQKEDKDLAYTQREFQVSNFARTFVLPDAADSDKISANYENGILSVTILKKEEAKVKPPRLIDVK
ncbi:MAG: Hsp20/alpha crystallin family protein [Candidatus Cyclobacteriaceae bacterium M3_2C_046]